MGDDTLMYRAYHIPTGTQLGGCYDFDGIGKLTVFMFFQQSILPKDIRFERVYKEQE